MENTSAPEIVSHSFISKKADIWSLGCIMFELLTNEVLFKVQNPTEINYIVIFLLLFFIFWYKFFLYIGF